MAPTPPSDQPDAGSAGEPAPELSAEPPAEPAAPPGPPAAVPPAVPPQRWVGRARVRPRAAVAVPTAAPPASSRVPAARLHRRRLSGALAGRLAIAGGLAVLLVVAGLGLLTYTWVSSIDDGLKRTDPFAAMAGRPAKLAQGTVNILLLGSDSRDPDAPTDQAGKWRTDTIVLMHIPASHDQAYLISFPRDLWVHIPRSQDGQHGDTMAKLNAAYAWGGTPLMVATIEEYTGVRLDHLVLIDFAGFVRVTDALGGIDLTVDRTVTSIFKPYRTFTKGRHHFSGAEALDYVRQRKQFPDGDFARMRHQQEFLKAIMDKAASRGTLTSPTTIKNFISSVADAITVDREFSMLDLAWQFHSLRSDHMVFLTSPYLGTDTIDGESVVRSDRDRAGALFDAVAKDTVGAWLAANSPPVKPGE